MTIRLPLRASFATLVAAAALQPALTAAQTPQFDAAGPWRYGASIYLYLPTVGGSTSASTAGGGSIRFDHGNLFDDSLKGAFMGSLEAHNGRWGVFTDYMYLHLNKGKQNSRDFSIGHAGLAGSTSANLDGDLKGTVWSLAGLYRLKTDPALTVDALGGFRMADVKSSLRWNISGDIGNLPPTDRSGASDSSETLWDGIVGLKGRYAFGAGQRWSVPFYIDVGAGQSRMTWQTAAGVSYAFSWGELSAMWRYLSYEIKSGRPVQDLTLNGPMVGATFRF